MIRILSGSYFFAQSWSWVIVAHIFEVLKKGLLVIVAHFVTNVSLVIMAHEKSDLTYLHIHMNIVTLYNDFKSYS